MKIRNTNFITILGFVIVPVVVLLIWLNFGHYPLKLFGLNLEAAAHYGESFGMINSLFSGLAFACLIITILLQWIELRQQRKEITRSIELQKESLSELKKQAELQNETQQILMRQADSLFLAAYVHALTARHESPSAQNIPIENRYIYELMDHTVRTLEFRAEKILGPTPHKNENEWLAYILNIERQKLINQWPNDTWRGDHPIDLWGQVIKPFGQWFEEFRKKLYSEINTADTVVSRVKEMETMKENDDFRAFWDRGNSLIFELDVLIRNLSMNNGS